LLIYYGRWQHKTYNHFVTDKEDRLDK